MNYYCGCRDSEERSSKFTLRFLFEDAIDISNPRISSYKICMESCAQTAVFLEKRCFGYVQICLHFLALRVNLEF
ncbi:hypothetical protein L218DRAFT_966008 [Marasmius fiardii PR-910]|nr:hypothetical protein L218DRAFT_966008 [Marasmius fiardii PR-910]